MNLRRSINWSNCCSPWLVLQISQGSAAFTGARGWPFLMLRIRQQHRTA
jgi:hypothetical protein